MDKMGLWYELARFDANREYPYLGMRLVQGRAERLAERLAETVAGDTTWSSEENRNAWAALYARALRAGHVELFDSVCSGNAVRLHWQEYEGRDYCDVRIDDGADRPHELAPTLALLERIAKRAAKVAGKVAARGERSPLYLLDDPANVLAALDAFGAVRVERFAEHAGVCARSILVRATSERVVPLTARPPALEEVA